MWAPATLIVVLLLVGGFVYFGVFNVAADSPHIRPVYAFLDVLRNRSIVMRARDIEVPANLTSPERLAKGAGLYSEMCSGCHLGPGIEKSELSQGLYPEAPDLTKASDLTTAQKFWVIKHGVKLSAMPAWGKTHNDELIWDMVAFVDKLSTMSPEEYKRTTESAPADHDEMMREMPGMNKDISGPAANPNEHTDHDHKDHDH